MTQRLVRVEAKLDSLHEDLDDYARDHKQVVREIGGIRPNGPDPQQTIRGRLHQLENDAAAAKLANDILAAERKRVGERWGRRERILAVIVGIWLALVPVINLALNVRQGK